MVSEDPKYNVRWGRRFKQCCLTNNKHRNRQDVFEDRSVVWNPAARRQVHRKQLTCELARSDSPNRDIYFQVLLSLCLSANEMKTFDKKRWLHIHSGMCQAEESCYYGGLAKWSRLVSWRNALCEHHSTPAAAKRAACVQTWVRAHHLEQAVSKTLKCRAGDLTFT